MHFYQLLELVMLISKLIILYNLNVRHRGGHDRLEGLHPQLAPKLFVLHPLPREPYRFPFGNGQHRTHEGSELEVPFDLQAPHHEARLGALEDHPLHHPLQMDRGRQVTSGRFSAVVKGHKPSPPW